eukprot:TRINITY_DN15148_c0_g1_i5.p1 TRINITY_DN15148_c0_g1~~TRINITY_DN15148_c0_g1_i5.p1  ORF type:complete len:599 (-),score=78.66 TRINITY_DN15148_c0_g1_i5:150-1946(-)
MNAVQLVVPAACLTALLLAALSTKRSLARPHSAIQLVIKQTSELWEQWRSQRTLDEDEQWLEERVASKMMQWRLGFASIFYLVSAWAFVLFLIMVGARSVREPELLIETKGSVSVIFGAFLVSWVGSFIDVNLKEVHLNLIFSIVTSLMSIWQLFPVPPLTYYRTRALVGVFIGLMSCSVQNNLLAWAGTMVFFTFRCFAEAMFFEDVRGITKQSSLLVFVISGVLFELGMLVQIHLGRSCLQVFAKLVFRARLMEETAGVEAKSLNKMVAGLSDCLVRLDRDLHICGNPQKLPQLLRSVSSSSLHWLSTSFLNYVADEDKERFRSFISSSASRSSSMVADAMHLTLCNGPGVRVLVQLFHARILGGMKDEAHLLAFQDLSKHEEIAEAAADTVFDLVPRCSVAPIESIASRSRASGGSSRKRKQKNELSQEKKDVEKPDARLVIFLEAHPKGVNVVKYEVRLAAKDKQCLGVRLERFVTPSDWLNLKMALDSKLDLTAPELGMSTHQYPVSLNLPLIGMVGVGHQKLNIFIPHEPEEGKPTKFTFAPDVDDSVNELARQKRRELQSRASDASEASGASVALAADCHSTEGGTAKASL